jgi:hypothetical protein
MMDFIQIRALLDRAEMDLDALDKEVRDFDKPNAQTTAILDYYNPVNQTHSVVFKEHAPIPQVEWGITLGEVVHNIRGALDCLVAQLVASAGQEIRPGHHFPIVTSKKEWNREVVKPSLKSPPKEGSLDFVDPRDVAIIRELQPDQSAPGLPSLMVLRELIEADRHRSVRWVRRPVVDQPRIEVSAAFPVTIASITYVNPGAALEDGAEIARYEPEFSFVARTASGETLMSANAQMQVNVQLDTVISFGQPGREHIRLSDVRDCLTDIRKRIVDRFADLDGRT